MSAGGKVTLESRQKLPQKVQDVICDVGLALQNAVQASPSSENVPNTLKTMAAMDTNNDAIAENLQKIDEILDQLDEDYQEMTNNVGQVTDVMDQLQNIERHKYFCAGNKNDTESDIDRSDMESHH